MRWNSHQLVVDAMGESEGVLMVEETGCVKKGKDSVGVARPYGGPLGKVEHGPGGAGYASRQGYARIEKRLFLPEAWFPEAYAARRIRCNVPRSSPCSAHHTRMLSVMPRRARPGVASCGAVIVVGLLHSVVTNGKPTWEWPTRKCGNMGACTITY
jgi:SRSO17 transposase